MKYLWLTLTVMSLVGCGGGPQQTLPPELMGGGTNPNQATPNNSTTGLPFETTAPTSSEPGNEIVESETVNETQTTKPEAPVLSVTAENCEALTLDLETSFADMNFCETNDDCQVAAGSCPFGCYLFHNASIDFADYQPALQAYQSGCNPCEYQCAEAPRASDRRCVEGRCVDARNQR